MTDNNKDLGAAQGDAKANPSSTTKANVNDESPKVKSKTPPKEKRPVSEKKKKVSLAVFVFAFVLVIVIALAAGGFWVWQGYQAQLNRFENTQMALQEALTSAQNKIQQLSSVNDQTKREFKNDIQSLENLLVQSAQKLNREANRTEYRWPLEEALTLTRLAAQRLQLDAHAGVAVGLLKSADQVLASLDQAAVLPLRRQLASDIQALQSTSSADINGDYFKLEAIAEQIKALNWMPSPSQGGNLASKEEAEGGFWASMKDVIVITKLDTALKAPPILSDFEQWRQRQLLLIEQVQLALLARNQALYDDALKQLQAQLSIMQGQFDLDPLLANLQSLAAAVLNPAWPDIDQSTQMIEQFLAEQPSSDQAQTEEAER